MIARWLCRYDTPLVADIHFQPAVAMLVADAFEKIRINPGNFVDGRKTFDHIDYDDESQFRAEQEHIREVRCRDHLSILFLQASSGRRSACGCCTSVDHAHNFSLVMAVQPSRPGSGKLTRHLLPPPPLHRSRQARQCRRQCMIIQTLLQ